MAIADDRLKQFFSKQRVGAFDALKQPPKTATPKNSTSNDDKTSIVTHTSLQPEKITANATVINEKESSVKSSEIEIQPHTKDEVKIEAKEPLANRERTVSNPVAVREQTVSETLAYSEQRVSNPLPKPLAQPLAKFEEIQFLDLRDFSKKERDLLTLIFWQCHHNCSLESPPISTEEIRNTLKISAERVRNLIFRISKKGGVKVTQHKSGQSAYRVFELPKSLYQWMADQQTNRLNMIEPLAVPLANTLANTTYSSNSNNLNKKTTTSLPEEWKKINFEVLQGLGFSETQLKQLFETNLTTPEIIQESINHFAYGLEHNEKTKSYKEPLNVLMGVLRKGQNWHEADYISPKELALKKIYDEKRKARERYDAMIKEMTEMDFPEWRKKLTDNQIKLIVSEPTLRMNLVPAINSELKKHFVENILMPKLEKMGIEE